MTHMLDTNIAIHLRDRDEEVMQRLAAVEDAVVLSIVTRIELEGGVYADPAKAGVRRPRLDAMLEALPVVAFDDAAAEAYRRILEAVGYSRRKVLDRMIAAQAIVHHATLVTRNPDEFRDVPGLDLLCW
jgi:predicted nucleic acid-binding protein